MSVAAQEKGAAAAQHNGAMAHAGASSGRGICVSTPGACTAGTRGGATGQQRGPVGEVGCLTCRRSLVGEGRAIVFYIAGEDVGLVCRACVSAEARDLLVNMDEGRPMQGGTPELPPMGWRTTE